MKGINTTLSDEYHIHTESRNLTFIKMYRHLKATGVDNNKFFLKLYDTDLADIDPYAKKLTKEIKNKIVIECARNPWYYIREIVRIPAPGKALRFVLNRGNLALTWSILQNLNPILLLPRQQGKTIGVVAILSWIYFFGTTNSEMLFSNKSVSDAINNLKRLKDILGLLPEFIKDAVTGATDTNNIESTINSKRNNSIRTKGAPLSVEQADLMG